MTKAPLVGNSQRKGRRIPLIAALSTATVLGGGGIAANTLRGEAKPAPIPAATAEAPLMTGIAACKAVVDVALKPALQPAIPAEKSSITSQVIQGIDLSRAITVSSEAAFMQPTTEQLVGSLEKITSEPVKARSTDAVIKASVAELANTASYNNSNETARATTAAAAAETDTLIEQLAPDNDAYHADVANIVALSGLANTQESTEQLVILSNGLDKQANQISMSMITERDSVVQELCAPFPEEINRYQNQ